jgi:amino acid adenylation domain-containing protein
LTAINVFLERLRRLDIRLSLDGDRLTLNAPKGAVTAELRDELRQRKHEIMALLQAEAAVAVARNSPRVSSVMERAARDGHLAVSHTQQRLWFINQLDPSGSVYNIPAALRLSGSVNPEALQKSLNDLVARHESLRSRFQSVDGIPYCVIEPHASAALEQMDLTGIAQIGREAMALRAADDFVRRRFDLTSAPLLRTLLIRTDDDLHVFAFALHHIIADGLSINVFLTELRAIYKHHVSGAPLQLPELSRQFVDYIEWERRSFAQGSLDEHEAFWKRQLTDLPSLLQLPTDRPRPIVQTSRGAHMAIQLSPDLTSQLTMFARNRGATLFMVLLAALEVLLHRYSGETDIAVGSVIANRNRIEMENVIGFFANTIVLRGDLSGNPTVNGLLARVRDVALNAYAHQDMPFDLLVDTLSTKRALDHSALFQVLLVLHKFVLAEFDMANLRCQAVERPGVTARFDISVDIFELPQGLRVYFEYNTDLFYTATIERMMQHYERLLVEFVSRPEANIDQLEMLTPSERQRMLVEWNNTAVACAERTVHGLFEEQAARNGDAAAVLFQDTQIGYAELNASANRLAHYLRSLGIGRDSLVGVCLERSTDMVVAVLGVLKAGAAYVPLDPAFPKDRINFMAADAKLEAVIIQTGLLAAVETPCSRTVSLDGDASRIAGQPSDNPAPLTDPHSLAYVIYTSGSTGLPKGVMITHGSVVNFLRSMQREPGITAADRFVAVTTLSFDIAGLEIFGPLTSGGTVVLASRAVALDGASMAELLDQSEATLLQATPAAWRLLIESGWRGRAGLKMLCGGEALPRDLAEKLLSLGGELWNLYGPTETTIWSTVSRIIDVDRPISIGRPIANTQLYLLEPGGHPAPIGVVGELFIGGDGVARGYLNRDEITAEKFTTLDLPLLGATRVYRTGDMARFLADGSLVFLGRRDHQVKVRGFRIELGEIETILAAHPGVKQSVVHVREDSPGDQRLVAYVVPTASEAFDADAARATLRAQLPEYMIPNIFAVLESLPLTPNGKVDRRALPSPMPTLTEARSTTEVTVMTPVQRQVAHLWQSILKLDRVTLHENFFDLGGHSLLLVRLHSALQREFDCQLQLVELFQRTTVATQAERVVAVPHSSDGALKRAQARAAKQAQLHG